MINSPTNGHANDATAEMASAALTASTPPSRRAENAESVESESRIAVYNFKPWKTRSVAAVALILAVTLVGAFAAASAPRARHERELVAAADSEAHAAPRRSFVTAQPGDSTSQRELPGNAQPYLTAGIYGRTNGYLKRWLVDIGDRVKAGQLMAEIATPEIDAQLEEAKATLLQNKANLLKLQADEVYARAEVGRYQPLLSRGAATQEAYDQKLATWKVDVASIQAMEATIQVNEADIQRLSALQSFERVTAPFNGIVTARNVDPGDLITADNPSTERQLFHVTQNDTLRVFVDVPQVFSTDVKPGQTATLYRRENPAKRYKGTVTRTANALDPNTRTLRTEVDVPNPKGELLPGMYLEVRFDFEREAVPVIIPTAAVIIRTGAPRVATLDEENNVRYREVKLGRDFGEQLEVLAGLRAGDRVIVYPGDDLPEGAQVDPVASSEQAQR